MRVIAQQMPRNMFLSLLDLMYQLCHVSLRRTLTSHDDSAGSGTFGPCGWLKAIPKAKIRRDILLGLD